MCIRDRITGGFFNPCFVYEIDSSSYFSVGITPVSYTHLDVYKRQVLHTIRKNIPSTADYISDLRIFD